MDGLANDPGDAQPIAENVREQILAPVIEAVATALREVAMTEVEVRATYRLPKRRLQCKLVAALELSSSALTCLTLGFSDAGAASLARRVLGEAVPNLDAGLIGDCIGELINVAGGQAKALLHGTPWHFTFGTPRLGAGPELPFSGSQECLEALLATDVGEVVLQLFLRDSDQGTSQPIACGHI